MVTQPTDFTVSHVNVEHPSRFEKILANKEPEKQYLEIKMQVRYHISTHRASWNTSMSTLRTRVPTCKVEALVLFHNILTK